MRIRVICLRGRQTVSVAARNERLTPPTVFYPGLKNGMVLLEEKGHFCSRNYILRALSRGELFYEDTLHKLWATHPMFEM